MEELTLGDRVSLLERQLEFSRELNAMMLAFLAHKMAMPLKDFAEWRSWVEEISAHRDEGFRLGLSFAEIEERAAMLLEKRADLAAPSSRKASG